MMKILLMIVSVSFFIAIAEAETSVPAMHPSRSAAPPSRKDAPQPGSALPKTKVPASTSKQAPQRTLLARFEVTKGAFKTYPPPPRRALMLYRLNEEIETVRITGDSKEDGGMGTFESMRLLRRIESLKLPRIDYQDYFKRLEKRPRRAGRDYWEACDGSEVEVEMHVNGTTVKFKMWNPDTFFYNYRDDKIASSVNSAVEAIVLALGKSQVYF